MMKRRHIVICPADPVDGHGAFLRFEVQVDGQIFKATPTGVLIANLMTELYRAIESGADFTFSGFRNLPEEQGHPDNYTLSPDATTTRLIVPLEAGESDAFGRYAKLVYYDLARPPVSDGIFVAGAGHKGIRQVIEQYFSFGKLESLKHRRYSRLHEEVWLRNSDDWNADIIAPGLFEKPKPTPSARPMTSAEYAAAKRGEAPLPQVLDAMETARKAAEPVPLTREEKLAAKEKRERIKKATQSGVAAAKANKEHAKTYAAKEIKKLELAGKMPTDRQIREMARRERGGR